MIEENKVVEYEREVRSEKKEENNRSRSHLTNKTFIDAMALLSDETK